ncbi:hypothetical protein [Terriglobus sp. ADX1]|uniref:hypothetical protein n=1 Tax=Terriglobus sp. ADX1 TaxID=2794063 RepID=UPI002FE663FF
MEQKIDFRQQRARAIQVLVPILVSVSVVDLLFHQSLSFWLASVLSPVFGGLIVLWPMYYWQKHAESIK